MCYVNSMSPHIYVSVEGEGKVVGKLQGTPTIFTPKKSASISCLLRVRLDIHSSPHFRDKWGGIFQATSILLSPACLLLGILTHYFSTAYGCYNLPHAWIRDGVCIHPITIHCPFPDHGATCDKISCATMGMRARSLVFSLSLCKSRRTWG